LRSNRVRLKLDETAAEGSMQVRKAAEREDAKVVEEAPDAVSANTHV
jgi:hypothetical protein